MLFSNMVMNLMNLSVSFDITECNVSYNVVGWASTLNLLNHAVTIKYYLILIITIFAIIPTSSKVSCSNLFSIIHDYAAISRSCIHLHRIVLYRRKYSHHNAISLNQKQRFLPGAIITS